MKRLLCALFGHRYARTGLGQMVYGVGWLHEYDCRRCAARTWE